MMRAISLQYPQMEKEKIDIIACRNTLGKLLDFVNEGTKTFEMDVEIIGETAIIIRKEPKATETIVGFRGFGFNFPDEYTTWRDNVKGSSSHHRAAKFEFAGLKYIMRYETDAYLPQKAELVEMQDPTADYDENIAMGPCLDERIAAETLAIAEKHPQASQKLTIHRRGTSINHNSLAEIKTRAIGKRIDMEALLPRLWLSQTVNIITAYHKGGRFNDINELDVRAQIDAWEKKNVDNLRKLDTLVRKVVEVVKESSSLKCGVSMDGKGKLRIVEHEKSYRDALPADLRENMVGKETKGGSDDL